MSNSESLMEPWKLLWRRQWFENGDIFIEDWQLQFLFFSKESVYWILYGKILLDLNCKLANVIQHRELVFMEIMMRYKVWSILWMLAKYRNRKRSKASMHKEKDRFDSLYEAQRSIEVSCGKAFSNFYVLCGVVLFY